MVTIRPSVGSEGEIVDGIADHLPPIVRPDLIINVRPGRIRCSPAIHQRLNYAFSLHVVRDFQVTFHQPNMETTYFNDKPFRNTGTISTPAFTKVSRDLISIATSLQL